MLHVPGSYVHGNITSYYFHGTSCIVGMHWYGISTTIFRNVYVLEKYEVDSCINSMQCIYYTRINGIFTLVGGFKFGVINNRPVITEI